MKQLNYCHRPAKRVDISINTAATGANIKRLIKASGYSIRDIMEITGISTEQAIYKWFRGESLPSIDSMIILCNALGIEIKELLVIDGEFDFMPIKLRVHCWCVGLLISSDYNRKRKKVYMKGKANERIRFYYRL